MRQLILEFVPRVRYLMRFAANVEKELASHMARAITEAAKGPEEGGRHERLRGKRQDH